MVHSIFNNDIHYIDFHTHRSKYSHRTDVIEIVSKHLDKFTPDEWYTIGKHPWWTSNIPSEVELRALKCHLQKSSCLALGEIGLDNLIDTPMQTQMEIVETMLHLLHDLNKPVVIHCVRAYDQLMRIKKTFSKISTWCIHGYARHATLAAQLIQAGFYISLMPPKRIDRKYIELVQSIPLEKCFLETDSMPDVHIESIYLQVAKIRNVPMKVLQIQMIENAKRFFGNP